MSTDRTSWELVDGECDVMPTTHATRATVTAAAAHFSETEAVAVVGPRGQRCSPACLGSFGGYVPPHFGHVCKPPNCTKGKSRSQGKSRVLDRFSEENCAHNPLAYARLPQASAAAAPPRFQPRRHPARAGRDTHHKPLTRHEHARITTTSPSSAAALTPPAAARRRPPCVRHRCARAAASCCARTLGARRRRRAPSCAPTRSPPRSCRTRRRRGTTVRSGTPPTRSSSSPSSTRGRRSARGRRPPTARSRRWSSAPRVCSRSRRR